MEIVVENRNEIVSFGLNGVWQVSQLGVTSATHSWFRAIVRWVTSRQLQMESFCHLKETYLCQPRNPLVIAVTNLWDHGFIVMLRLCIRQVLYQKHRDCVMRLPLSMREKTLNRTLQCGMWKQRRKRPIYQRQISNSSDKTRKQGVIIIRCYGVYEIMKNTF